MSKTAKITASKQTRTFEGKKGGTFYVHAIELDNGDKGEYTTDTQEASFLNVGQTLEYTIEPNGNFPDKIRKAGGKFAGKPGGYPREAFEEKAVGFAFSYAKDLTVAGKLEPGKKMIETANAIYDAMLATAKRGRV